MAQCNYKAYNRASGLVRLKDAEGFGATISEETKEALRKIDENIARAKANAHNIIVD